MYQILLPIHNTLRWLILAGLLLSIYRSYRGYFSNFTFSKTDHILRHWVTSIVHVQLIVGMLLYFKSPMVTYLFNNFKTGIYNSSTVFFGLIHSSLMLVFVVLITIGSATAKRAATDKNKFRLMLMYFGSALFILLIAIPWPFSPFAARPLFRL